MARCSSRRRGTASTPRWRRGKARRSAPTTRSSSPKPASGNTCRSDATARCVRPRACGHGHPTCAAPFRDFSASRLLAAALLHLFRRTARGCAPRDRVRIPPNPHIHTSLCPRLSPRCAPPDTRRRCILRRLLLVLAGMHHWVQGMRRQRRARSRRTQRLQLFHGGTRAPPVGGAAAVDVHNAHAISCGATCSSVSFP